MAGLPEVRDVVLICQECLKNSALWVSRLLVPWSVVLCPLTASPVPPRLLSLYGTSGKRRRGWVCSFLILVLSPETD